MTYEMKVTCDEEVTIDSIEARIHIGVHIKHNYVYVLSQYLYM